MPSPDFSSYVDLTLFDTDATTVLNEILTHARGVIPQWQPEAGNIEVVLAEAFANETANLAAYINRLPDATAETLMQLFGITKSDGAKATATITVTMVDTAGYTLAAGTPVAQFTVGGLSLVYLTDTELTVSSGSSSGVIGVTAQVVGTDHNTPSLGDSLQALISVTYIASIVFATAPTGGLFAESDDVYFDRATNLLGSYSSALATASQIQAHVLGNHTFAWRCNVYDKRRLRDRDTQATGYGLHPGYALIAVAGQNADQSDTSDVTVSASSLAAIEADVESRTSAGVAIDIMSAELVSVVVTCDFVVKAGFDPDAVELTVDAALDVYLDPNVWPWTSVVRNNELIALVDGVAGVDYVTLLTTAGTTVIGTNPNYADIASGVRLDNLGTLVMSGSHVLTGTAAS